MFGLESIAPRFLVPSKRIKVLYEPADFYAYLRTRILTAKSRVFLASLYLGRSEQELIDTLAEALRKNNELHVHVLVDALRGTREAPNPCSASLLAPLAEQFPARVQLSMYKTPKLGKLLGAVLPKRIIEGVGLQHMKLYGFDNEIVLSGANLSNDYFTNRQDRYISIDNAEVTNWFFKLQQTVSQMSETLLPMNNEQGFTLVRPSRKARRAARFELAEHLKPSSASQGLPGNMQNLVEVYPVGQFTPFRLGTEHAAMERVLEAAASPKYAWLLTAGYFNIAPSLAREVVNAENGEIIVAAPEANGFYKSKGISGRLPHFYSILLRRFLEQIPESNESIVVREWRRGVVNTPGGWSYHAKGIWLWEQTDAERGTEPRTERRAEPSVSEKDGAVQRAQDAQEATLPFMTYIGSSNFTRRGYMHDIEAGAVLITHRAEPGTIDPLAEQLRRERAHLREQCGGPLDLRAINPVPTIRDRFLLWIFGDRL